MNFEPIGYLRSGRGNKFLTPSQPEGSSAAVVELLEGFETALHDLEGFSRIWLIWWFHQNRDWRPKVLPPQGRSGRKGLFATRSPHRPCPLGLSAVPLLGVEGRRLFVGEHDLVEGTPILDIKPYIPRFDAFPDEQSGWFGELDLAPRFALSYAPRAEAQLAWLSEHHDPQFGKRVQDVLQVDPLPHRTRRIFKQRDGSLRLSCGDFRVYYRIEGALLRIERVASREGATGPLHEAFAAL